MYTIICANPVTTHPVGWDVNWRTLEGASAALNRLEQLHCAGPHRIVEERDPAA